MRKSALALFSILVLGGCAGAGRPHAEKAHEMVSPEVRREILDSLRARNESLVGLRGLATVRYGGALFGARGETSFAVRRPGRLRIDALSDFGSFLSQLALRDGDLTILWPSDNSYFRGRADVETMARYLRVHTTPEEAVSLLMGVVPLADDAGYVVRPLGKTGRFALEGNDAEIVVEAHDGAYRPVSYVAFKSRGSGRRRDHAVEYSDYAESVVPSRIEARFYDPASRIRVEYRDVEVNPQLDGKLFELKIPDDATPVMD